MAAFWQLHPWLIIILAVLAVPLVQALLDPFRRFLAYRERRDANRGAEGLRRARTRSAAGGAGGAREPTLGAAVVRGSWRREQATGLSIDFGVDQLDRWVEFGRSREPYRRWNGATFTWAIAAGFGFASQHVHQYADTYLVIAVIAAALAVAATLSALRASFWRGRV